MTRRRTLTAQTAASRAARGEFVLVAHTHVIWPVLMRPGDVLCVYEGRGLAHLRRNTSTGTPWRILSRIDETFSEYSRLSSIGGLQADHADGAIALQRLALEATTTPARAS